MNNIITVLGMILSSSLIVAILNVIMQNKNTKVVFNKTYVTELLK